MLTDRGYGLIQSFEGYIRKLPDGGAAVYLDPVGIPTVGWGSTRYFTYDGKSSAIPTGRVKAGDPPITRARAEECFHGELYTDELAVDRFITVKLHPLMRDALASFAYNCGEGALRASSLRAVVNRQEWDKVPREFAKWRMAGGVVLAGLTRRRRSEADLFMEGVRRLQSGETGVQSAPAPAQAQAPTPAPAPAPLPPPPAAIAKADKSWWRSIVEWVFK